MNIAYNESLDILTLTLSRKRIVTSDEIEPGIIVDYGAKHAIVSIEILDASTRVDDPASVSLRLATAA